MYIYHPDHGYQTMDLTTEEFASSSLIAKGWVIQDPPQPPAPTLEEVRASAVNQINETSRQMLDLLVYSAGKKAEYDRNFEIINSATSPERTAFLTDKAVSFAGYTLYEPDGVTIRKRVVIGDMQSFVDYAVEAKALVTAAGDAIVNERGNAIQRVTAAADEAAINNEVAAYQAFCNGKLYALAVQWGRTSA